MSSKSGGVIYHCALNFDTIDLKIFLFAVLSSIDVLSNLDNKLSHNSELECNILGSQSCTLNALKKLYCNKIGFCLYINSVARFALASNHLAASKYLRRA